ncbi:MAG: alanine--tRNA ligase [Flavobacteriia bacterium]|nr:alanine--tRNA ligase [Flavobacteriia bacterium]OJX36739.1 MAG: alanine--tRNA ligase [Flavobacteriia bacterium 40-80]
MKLQEIRQHFFDFFEKKGHLIVPSAPMVIKNDPTLMFTNAGMNQFKDYFLGNEIPKHRRVANSQKCLRVSGKHNDLEEVGVDTYHHTMFEMLGNWSFGDYFKKEAIEWAWELLTEVYKIPKDRLYVTVFEGDEKDGVPADTESFEIWKKYIDEDRIILASKKDNFWEMGDTGPCGPCTEIHVDLRSDSERARIDGRSRVNQDDPQVIEIWNNVFMQFNRKADGSLEKLPETHVDTGMGLERLTMALQGKTSNYDTDLFQSLIQHMVKVSGFEYGASEEVDIALRVIADHIRAIAFAIADGQLPSNTGAGYVIRRILRRAVRYGYSTLKLKEPFLSDLSVLLGQLMGDPYKELLTQKDIIRKVIFEEEQSFFRTLEQGIRRINALIETTKAAGLSELKGTEVFELYDTYGFPVDLTSLIARENELTVDEKGFDEELEKQKNRSRSATAIETDDWVNVTDDQPSEFVGYDERATETKIIKYRKVTQKQKTFYQLVLSPTPFYAEGGGQVGDKGYIEANGEKTFIFDTKKENGLIVHFTEKLPTDPKADFTAVVDINKRALTTSNHSATHLLHHALRTVLGAHVEQKGSLVNENYLRFDFSHFSKVTPEELEKVEFLVNEEIRKAVPLNEIRSTTMEVAQEMGAMALFGEKYGDKVRVIRFGDSVELCGGTHVPNTSDIRLFKFTTETAVAAGIRRVEAITNITAENELKSKAALLDEISVILKNPKDLKTSIEELIAKNHALQKEVEKLQKEKAMSMKNELKNKIVSHNGAQLLIEKLNLDANSIKDILYALKGETSNFIGLIGGVEGDKCSLSLIIDETLVKEKDLNAGAIIREISKFIQGGGGGQPFFATAGGKNPAGLKDAFEAFKTRV